MSTASMTSMTTTKMPVSRTRGLIELAQSCGTQWHYVRASGSTCGQEPTLKYSSSGAQVWPNQPGTETRWRTTRGWV